LEGRRGLGFLSELNDVFTPVEKDAAWYKSPLSHLTKIAQKPYQLGVKLNETVALIAGWQHSKNKMFPGVDTLDKVQYKAVYDEAVRIAAMVNNTLGKINRPTAMFGSDKPMWRTTAQALYSLQSYVGMTYANTIRQYRKSFGEYAKSLPAAERTNAKIALAQAITTFVALAGVAGIPLLLPLDKLQEKMTGVSIKDSLVTMMRDFGGPNGDFFGDVANHGLAHAFGLPFDFSSRVAPAGMFGVNAYDGFSADRLLGPAYGIGVNLFSSLDHALQGNWTQAMKKGMPPVVGNTFALLANDGELVDNRGNKLSAPSQTWGNKLASVIGFKPSEVVRNQDQATIATRANDAATRQNKETAGEVASALLAGDVQKARALLADVQRASQGLVDPMQILEQGLDIVEGQTLGQDLRDLATLGASQEYDTHRQAPLAPTAGKLERLQMRNQYRRMLGVKPYSTRRIKTAGIIDQIRSTRPTLSTARARAIAESMVGGDSQDYFQMMSGL
jgi:hypothetical protein